MITTSADMHDKLNAVYRSKPRKHQDWGLIDRLEEATCYLKRREQRGKLKPSPNWWNLGPAKSCWEGDARTLRA